MLEETSGCTTNPTVDTNAKQNSKCSGQTTHCAQGPVMQKGRRSSSVNTCCAQLCPPHCCAGWEPRCSRLQHCGTGWLWAQGDQPAGWESTLVNTLCSQGGKWKHCSLTWAAQQRWKMEEGGRAMPAGAHHCFHELIAPLQGRLFPESQSSPPLHLPLKDFEKVLASSSQCFPPQNWNVIAGKGRSTREAAWHKAAGRMLPSNSTTFQSSY